MFTLIVNSVAGVITDEVFDSLAMRNTIQLGVDAVFVMIGLLTLRRWVDLVPLALFIVIGYISSIKGNGLSIVFFANGSRDFISLLFIPPIIRYFNENEFRRQRFIRAFDRWLFLFLCLQFPTIIFQFLKYKAGDHVGGTLGNLNSGNISILIYLISFYLIRKRFDPDHFFYSLYQNKIYLILLLPTFLNETKVSLLFLLMYFGLLITIDRKFFIRMMYIFPAILVVLTVGIALYTHFTNQAEFDVTDPEFIENYLLVDPDEAEGGAKWEQSRNSIPDVPRFTKIIMIGWLEEENPGHLAMGYGVGQFKGGSTLDLSGFSNEYDWLLSGSIPYLFHMMIQLGIIGMVWLVFILLINFGVFFHRCRIDYNIQLYILGLILIIMFYNDSLRYTFMMMPMMYMLINSYYSPKEAESEPNADASHQIN